MKKKETEASDAALTDKVKRMGWFTYPGPHPQVRLQLPEVGEMLFDRGTPVQLPIAVGLQLARRKKLRGSRAPRADEGNGKKTAAAEPKPEAPEGQ